MIPLGPFEPDRPDYNPKAAFVEDAIPTADGWGSHPEFIAISDALPEDARGAFVGKVGDTATLFVGSATGLYTYNTSTRGWTDVSSTTYSLASGDQWSFEQFGNFIIAVNINDNPQVFELGVDSAFSDLGGAPPQARTVFTVNGHLGLAGLDGNEQSIQWSGLNDIEVWDATVKQSDSQYFPEGGKVLCGVSVRDDSAIIFQENATRIMTPDPQAFFSFRRIGLERGISTPYAVATALGLTAYNSEDGFYLSAGDFSGIDKARINKFFRDSIDVERREEIYAATDPFNKIFWWRYPRGACPAGQTNAMLGYNWELDRWCIVNQDLQCFFTGLTSGVLMDDLDIPVDSLNIPVDSPFWVENVPVLAGFNSENRFGFFLGNNREARILTNSTQLSDEKTQLLGFRVATDCPDVQGRAYANNRLCDAFTNTDYKPISSRAGMIWSRIIGRNFKFELKFPSGSIWKNATALKPEFRGDMKR
jgi:hypothetical protein